MEKLAAREAERLSPVWAEPAEPGGSEGPQDVHIKEMFIENNFIKKRSEAKIRYESRGCGQERKELVEPLGNCS